MTTQMHADEVAVPLSLVRILVDRQYPEWEELPLRPVDEFGTDHKLFRLGDELLVRMPVYGGSADQAASDAAWLPRLAPHLPVDLPVPVAVGEPDAGYPFEWSVVRWLPGVTLDRADVDPVHLAEELAAFVLALQAVDPLGGPPKTGTSRGVPLDPAWDVEREIERELSDPGERARASRVWQAALDAGPWPGEPRWIHGDLLEGNLLVCDGRLSAVIDWGAVGVADPAPDVAPAFTLFEGEARHRYRELLSVDDATWARAKAWVMLPALSGLTYYAESVPAFTARGRRHLDAVLCESD
jgi:aminoglycoside phosphotransferase (APT) family kinase protein